MVKIREYTWANSQLWSWSTPCPDHVHVFPALKHTLWAVNELIIRLGTLENVQDEGYSRSKVENLRSN